VRRPGSAFFLSSVAVYQSAARPAHSKGALQGLFAQSTASICWSAYQKNSIANGSINDHATKD